MWRAVLVSEPLLVHWESARRRVSRGQREVKFLGCAASEAGRDQGREFSKKPARGGRMVGKTVLVTGAGGFIGSHLVERLVRDGHRVRVLVRYNGRDDHGHVEDLPANIQSELEFTRGDLKDPVAVRKAVRARE